MRASLLVLLGALITTPVLAGDTFAFTDPCDELALARAADAAGDARLATSMQAGRYEAVLAIRASEHAQAPELLVPALAAHACGRDPTLAPEAAATLRKLVRRLAPSELAQREALHGDLERARAALHCERAPRADIAAALAELAASIAP
ncbi:MAG: hypothetical protein ABW352_12915 [Polyangiales bacterium]